MRVLRTAAVLIMAASTIVLTGSGAAADDGSLADPRGELPDIVKLSYDNDANAVRMAMTYVESSDVQNESFYLSWGAAGKRYQVFESQISSLRELRFYAGPSAVPKRVPCGGLKVVHRAGVEQTRVVIPRSCIPKAANALRFQANANGGSPSLVDETKKSARVRRG